MLNKIMNSKYFWIIPALYMGMIFILSSIPADANDRMAGIYINRNLQDLLHIPLYGLLILLWIKALKNRGIQGPKAILLAISICLVYSVFDEFHQSFIPGRYCSLSDFLFDTAGSFMAVPIAKNLKGKKVFSLPALNRLIEKLYE